MSAAVEVRRLAAAIHRCPARYEGPCWGPTPADYDKARKLIERGVGDVMEKKPRECPDGGRCHHQCDGIGCFRVACCEPLSGVYTDNEWPEWLARSVGEDLADRGRVGLTTPFEEGGGSGSGQPKQCERCHGSGWFGCAHEQGGDVKVSHAVDCGTRGRCGLCGGSGQHAAADPPALDSTGWPEGANRGPFELSPGVPPNTEAPR